METPEILDDLLEEKKSLPEKIKACEELEATYIA